MTFMLHLFSLVRNAKVPAERKGHRNDATGVGQKKIPPQKFAGASGKRNDLLPAPTTMTISTTR